MELMVLEYRLDNVIPDQFGQQMLSCPARDVGQAAIPPQGKTFIFLHQPEQQLLAFGKLHQLTFRIPALLPHPQMDGRSQDILIGHTDISQFAAICILGVNRFAGALVHGSHQHAPPLHLVDLHLADTPKLCAAASIIYCSSSDRTPAIFPLSFTPINRRPPSVLAKAESVLAIFRASDISNLKS